MSFKFFDLTVFTDFKLTDLKIPFSNFWIFPIIGFHFSVFLFLSFQLSSFSGLKICKLPVFSFLFSDFWVFEFFRFLRFLLLKFFMFANFKFSFVLLSELLNLCSIIFYISQFFSSFATLFHFSFLYFTVIYQVLKFLIFFFKFNLFIHSLREISTN